MPARQPLVHWTPASAAVVEGGQHVPSAVLVCLALVATVGHGLPLYDVARRAVALGAPMPERPTPACPLIEVHACFLARRHAEVQAADDGLVHMDQLAAVGASAVRLRAVPFQGSHGHQR